MDGATENENMLKIRPAITSDAPAIAALHREAVLAKGISHYPEDTLNDWSPVPTPERISRLASQIAHPGLIVLVAVANDEILGFTLVDIANNELGAVYVKPNMVGNVGSALLAEIEKRAFPLCEFLTCDASLNAERFYKRNGYVEERRGDHVLRSGKKIACIHMRKRRPQV